MTTGEIARMLERLQRSTDGLHEKLDARPTWEDVKRLETARDKQITDVQTDVHELQQAQTWLYRLTIGAVITAVLSWAIAPPPL